MESKRVQGEMPFDFPFSLSQPLNSGYPIQVWPCFGRIRFKGGQGKKMKGRGIKGGGEVNKKGWRNQGEFKRGKGFQSLPVDLGPFNRFGWSGFGSFQVWAMASPG